MKLFTLILGLAALPAVAALYNPEPRIAYANPRSYYEARVDLAEPERPRIQRHLAAVEAALRARPVTNLTESQRRNRLARLDDLHAYWTRGEFPQNLDFPDRLIPYFIDARGVPCAMGHLVIQSGGREYAEEIRRDRNNAYIGEIAAADPRLAAWTEANGMTLEEAAMVQPAYGGTLVNLVTRVLMDSAAKPWVFGWDQNFVGGTAIFNRPGSEWVLKASGAISGFCLTPSGQMLLLGNTGASWNARAYTLPSGSPSLYGQGYSCDWSPSYSEAWIGTNQGLWRFARGGSADTMAVTRFSTSLASDSVTGVAAISGAVWASTPRELYRRGTSGSDTAVTVMDSAALSVLKGLRVTGLKGTGNKVWAGFEGNAVPYGENRYTFSTRGLWMHNGVQSRRFISSMSSVFVPGDTITALGVRDSATVWLAVPGRGFFKFPSSSGTGKVADIPAGVTVYDLVGDTNGFYAGTSRGVYQFRNDSLVNLGVPAVSIRPSLAGKGIQNAPRLRVLTAREAAALGARSVLGQRTGSKAGAGVYLVPPSIQD
jgi:hypothetical protein